MIDSSTIIKGYERYLEKEKKRITEDSKNRKIRIGQKFLDHLISRSIRLEDVTEEFVENYREEVKLGQKVCYLNEFISYLERENYILFRKMQMQNGVIIADPQVSLKLFLENELNKGAADRNVYILGHLIQRFLNYLSEHNINDLTLVSRKVISDYSMYLLLHKTNRGKTYNANTRHTILSNIRIFFKFLLKREMIFADPTDEIELPRLPKKIFKDVPTSDEITKMLDVIDTKTAFGVRDYAIIELFYGTGMRLQELINLTVDCIDFEKKFVTIRKGKGDRDRVVPVNDVAIKWIKRYLEMRENKRNLNENILFFNNQNRKIRIESMPYMFMKYTRDAKIKKNIHAHSFRVACATHMMKNGCDISVIQEMLGHEYLTTTTKYTQVLKSDLKKMLRKFHPRDARVRQ